MNSRLFWKILPGFGITLIFVLHGVWIAYAVASEGRSSSEREALEIVAGYQLSAAQMAIESGGIARFKEVSKSWEPSESNGRSLHEEWNRLSVVEAKRVGARQEASPAPQNVLVRSAIDPASKEWELRYVLPLDSQTEPLRIIDFFRAILTVEWAISGLMGGLLFSAILVWYLSRPIQRLRSGFRKLADGELATRLRPSMGRRRDEIADLANDFDRMAERLQQLVLARDRLLHDVSHELRSPLARLNLAVALARQDDGTPKEPLQRIGSEVGRLDDLVGELLSLSRDESVESELDAYFDMGALLDAVVADASFEAKAKYVSIVVRIETAQQVLMQGSAKLIRRAIENIVRNAIQFSARGSPVELTLSVDEDLHQLVLQIADRGPGVHEADLHRMQEPFVRLNNGLGRQGYGLGLAIASRAVHSHKGRLDVANRVGGGLVITVTLPLANTVLQVADPSLENEG